MSQTTAIDPTSVSSRSAASSQAGDCCHLPDMLQSARLLSGVQPVPRQLFVHYLGGFRKPGRTLARLLPLAVSPAAAISQTLSLAGLQYFSQIAAISC
jgi:hypothetical protein